MLAKAVATEAGANFINISMSSITSKVNRMIIFLTYCFFFLIEGLGIGFENNNSHLNYFLIDLGGLKKPTRYKSTNFISLGSNPT